MTIKIEVKSGQEIVLNPAPGRGSSIIVMSISGGKDSMAMWLYLWEIGVGNLVPVHIRYGWEWPEAIEEIKRVEGITGTQCYEVNRLGAYEREIRKRGWSTWVTRWCAGMKRDDHAKIVSAIKRGHPGFKIEKALGVAADEKERTKAAWTAGKDVILPLVEARLTQMNCLALCSFYGCKWKGHYIKYQRFSCWPCPRQRLNDLRLLWVERPELWSRLIAVDKIAPEGRKWKWGKNTLGDLQERFKREYEAEIIGAGKRRW